MIHIIIASYKEPKSTIKAVEAFLSQNIKEKFKIIIADPFPETEKILKAEFKKQFKSGEIEFFLDPGEGKSYALNVIFEKIYSSPNDIIILTDGDVYVSQNSVKAIAEAFKDRKVGCITGKPVPIDSRKKMLGYFAHVAFSGVDKTRMLLSKQQQFFECSGYLFAIRNGVLQGFPLETSEDSIIPYLFWEKGYKIKYIPEAEVYVKNPETLKDYTLQKIRNIKAHENLSLLAKNMPRTKSFSNEIKYGALYALTYPKNLKEIFYTPFLFILRLYIYIKAFYDLKFKKKEYQDGWRAEGETKTTSLS